MIRYLLLDIDWRFLNYEFGGEQVSNYLWCAGIILATLLLKRPVTTLLARISSVIARYFSRFEHEHRLGRMIRPSLERLLQTVLYYIAINQLSTLLDSIKWHKPLGSKHETFRLGDVVDHLFLFFFIIFLTQVISHTIDYFYRINLDKAKDEKNRARMQLLPLLKEMGKLLIWTFSIFWILGSVFLVNVPALITGLGIGGVAIALAGKTTVENFFAAFTILSDKPFQVGDTVRMGDMEGVVERIGFRSTRIRNSNGSAYIVPNQALVGGTVLNLTQRDVTGVKVTINIKYGVSDDILQKIIDEIRQTIKTNTIIREPINVVLDSFGNDTFQVIISYFLPYPMIEGNTVDKVKQEINMQTFAIVTKYTGKGATTVTATTVATADEDQSNTSDKP